MTVRELIKKLADYDMDGEVTLALCDDDANAAGGYFVAVEEVAADANVNNTAAAGVVLRAYADTSHCDCGEPMTCHGDVCPDCGDCMNVCECPS